MGIRDVYTVFVYAQYVFCLGFLWVHLYYKKRRDKSLSMNKDGLENMHHFRMFFQYRPLYINIMNTLAVVSMTFSWLIEENLCVFKDVIIFFSTTLLFLPLYSRVTVLYMIDKEHKKVDVKDFLKGSDKLVNKVLEWFRRRHSEKTFCVDLFLYSLLIQLPVLMIYFFAVDNSSCSEGGCFFCSVYIMIHSIILFLWTVFGLRSVYKSYDLHKELFVIAIVSAFTMIVTVVYNVLLKEELSASEDQFLIVALINLWMAIMQGMLYLYPIWSWSKYIKRRKKIEATLNSQMKERYTVESVLNDEKLRKKFEEFCRKHFITENFIFLMLVRNIRRKKNRKIGHWRKKIEPFFTDQGTYELNIEYNLRQKVDGMLKKKDDQDLEMKIVEDVYKQISQMLTGDKIPTFEYNMIQENENKV